MKQVNKVKAISALPIHSRDIFFKKEMGKINASKDLFNNIRDTFSNKQKTIFKHKAFVLKDALDFYSKKLIRGKKLSKQQYEQLNEAKSNINNLYAYLIKKIRHKQTKIN